MNFRHLRRFSLFCGAIAGIVLAAAPSARANVYATDVKVNSGFTNITVSAGTGATVSYILNEPATLGVTVNILLSGQSIRTLTVPAGGPGALRGTNAVIWDGLDLNSNTPPGGLYSVSVTAATSGFTNWTQTSVDTNAGNYVYAGAGVAVDRNTNSPFYGRVFVSSSELNQSGTNQGDLPGILKLNADGSPADESPTNWLSTGGYSWADNGYSPWKLAVSADDHVYVDDLQEFGWIYRWDPTVSSNSQLFVLRSDNQASGVNLSGPGLFGSGTNTEIWMADQHSWLGFVDSLGVLRYNVTANGTCASNNTGTVVVAPSEGGTGTNLDESPYAVTLDGSHNIYTIQNVFSGDPSECVLRFPAYNPATNDSAPEITATWAVGTNDSFVGASGVAVDSTGNYVAVAFAPSTASFSTNGNVRVLSAATGALLADLDLDTNAVAYDDTDCAWDAVGNVYFIRSPLDTTSLGFWRVMSPPGTNQATTVAVATIQVMGAPITQPQITSISDSNGVVTIIFEAGTNDPPGDFTLQSSAFVGGPFTTVTATITSIGPGLYEAVLPANGADQFYQVIVSVGPPQLTTQPTSQTVWAGYSVAIDVVTFSTGPISYQWLFNGGILTNDVISTVAGMAANSYSGDGGLATNAALYYPSGVALDAAGNMFIADNGNNRIRKVGNNGIVTTVAGNGTNGFSGDGGPAVNATLDNPAAVAVDSVGNLFIADQNCRIRKVGTNGIITTIAGTGTNAYSGDGGPATNADISTPPGLALDVVGNLYIADVGNQRIRVINTNGIITTVAGNGTIGYGGDGVPATNTSVGFPSGVAVDASGNLYIADYLNNRIRKVDTNDVISTVAGTSTAGFSGDGGPATNASLDHPVSVAVDTAGNIYFSDSQTNRVRRVGASGTITTFAGNSHFSFSGDGGPATNATLNGPDGLAADPAGSLFIVDSYNSRVRKVINTQGPELALNNATPGNAGAYEVVVTGPGGSVTSSVANLTVVSQPLIYQTLRLPNGSMALSFLSRPGSTNVVLYSTNLSSPTNWFPLSTNLAGSDGTWQYTDTGAGALAKRFYRFLMH